MSSGERQIVVSPLERAVSTDIMRGQSFMAACFNQFMQALLDNGAGTDDVQAGALATFNTSSGTPASGQIMSGLLFSPVGASSAASVGPGVAMIYDPDAVQSTDDSQYKFVNDPGTVTASLALTANASGQLRMDVVECARVQPDNVVETDNRDIFNTVTGLFTAATVNKVTQAQLQYRIRTGTAGSGFPGAATGWMPLAVASVPSGTTTWDTVTIWDVRPLLEDRLFSLTRATRDLPKVTRCMAQIHSGLGAGGALTGLVEAELGDRRVGGIMQPSGPQTSGGPDALFIDLTDANNQSAGGVATTGFNYVYICTPFGLPGWRKYTATGTRVPRSPRGVVFNSNVTPNLSYGTPSSPLVLPPALQNGANSSSDSRAVCVLARIGAAPSANSVVATGGSHWSQAPTPTNTATSGSGLTTATFTLTAGVDFPANARAVYLALTGVLDLFSGSVTSYAFDGGTVGIAAINGINGVATIALVDTARTQSFGPTLSGGVNYAFSAPTFTSSARVPVPPTYELIGTPGTTPPGASATFVVTWSPAVTGSGTAWTFGGNPTLTIKGWELADAD